ncbi:MAG: 23S rRNA (uracil(1939)-C(5))-methyltransferase RlmD [Nitrospinae bacterium]|nr:23S rRNA (uracil(1939)-C(5))-methyltransferase RlmD [Nitrospinota bacterium]
MEYMQGNRGTIEIKGLSNNGEGIGLIEGRKVFVPGSVTGDVVDIRLVTVKKEYGVAKPLKVLESSPYFIKPVCIVADKCGGCQWLHVKYDYQLQEKKEQVLQTLKETGGFENPPLEDILPSPEVVGYRNKSTCPFEFSSDGKVRSGFYRKGSHRIVNINQCPVQDSRLDPLLKKIKEDIILRGWSIYDEKKCTGEIRNLSLRIGKNTGGILITLISASENLTALDDQSKAWMKEFPNVRGVCLNINPTKGNVNMGKETRCIAGEPFIKERFMNLDLIVGSSTFFQVNTKAAELLYQYIEKELMLSGKEKVLDLYCGIGTFTLPIAQQVREVIGIENHSDSVKLAQKNAENNAIKNVRFLSGNVENIFDKENFTPDIILLDPPRRGNSKAVLKNLRDIKAKKIVYVSCNPVSLARDLKVLCDGGLYFLKKVKPVDFFPQTSHIETIVFLERGNDEVSEAKEVKNHSV